MEACPASPIPAHATRRTAPWLGAAATLLAAVFLIFVLPLYVPMRPFPVVSLSYLAGFNNRVAILASAALSVAVFLCTWWASGPSRAPLFSSEDRLSPRFVAIVLTVSALILTLCGSLVAASHNRYLGDAGYIIEQATVWHQTGRTLYADIEFAYGPLLLLPEIWLSQLLHCSITAAYYVTLVLESTLGLLLLAYVLNQLPLRGRLRRAAFLLLAVGAITPHLGLNYTFLRFVPPFAILLFAARFNSPWPCALLLAAGEVVLPLISPELGLAFAVGVLAFGLIRARQQGVRWVLTLLLPLGALGALLLLFGGSYLKSTASFSRGGLSLPVGPYPHILIYLFALLWLVPRSIAHLSRAQPSRAALYVALYATALAYVPAALGRCDPLHVLFNGCGILILSLLGFTTSARSAQYAWIAALACLVLCNHFVNEKLFASRTAEVLHDTVFPSLSPATRTAVVRFTDHFDTEAAGILADAPSPEYQLDLNALDRLVGHDRIATPLEISPTVEHQLQQSGHASPEFYAFWVNMMSPAAERRSIQQLNSDHWMLLPAELHPDFAEQPSPDDADLFQGFDLGYRQRNPSPYHPGALFLANLKQRWVPVQPFGPYLLYRQQSLP